MPLAVRLGMKPAPSFLKAGDVVTLRIEGLGEQKQKVVVGKYWSRVAHLSLSASS